MVQGMAGEMASPAGILILYECRSVGWRSFAHMGGCFIPSIADYAMRCASMEAKTVF